MSFKLDRLLYLAISCVIGIFFLIVGVFGIILPWSHVLQTLTIQFIQEKTLILSLFGLGLALIGLSMIAYALLHTRHRYVDIRTGGYAVTLDENVVRSYLEKYWEERFPESHIPFDITFKKRAIQIVVTLPPLPLQEQKPFLEQVKQDFNELFGRTLGYPYDVHLMARFEEPPLQSAERAIN